MKKAAKDPVREERIHDEAIVDASGPEEKAMSWYYYLESKLTFPYQSSLHRHPIDVATEKRRNCRSPAHGPGRHLCERHVCSDPLAGPNLAVPLSQLVAIDPDEETTEAVGDWHYRVAQGYLF
jgi:hypothetical protein